MAQDQWTARSMSSWSSSGWYQTARRSVVAPPVIDDRLRRHIALPAQFEQGFDIGGVALVRISG